MSPLTTHILDTSIGKPAKGISVILEEHISGDWQKIGEGITSDDGRINDLLPNEKDPLSGIYRLIFDTKKYFGHQAKPCFFPRVTIEFEITNASHHHVPLLLSPYGYTTYRGS